MGERIQQSPVRMKMGLLTVVSLLTALATKGALSLLKVVDTSVETWVAIGAGLLMFTALAVRLTVRFPSFTLIPSHITKIEWAGRNPIFRIHLANSSPKLVLITGGQGKEGTAHQLLRVLPGAMMSSAVTSREPDPDAAGPWRALTKSQALEQLRVIAEGRSLTAAEPEEGSHRSEEVRPEQGEGPSAPGSPSPELLEQWREDDEYAAAQLLARGVREGTYGVLRLLTWALMLGSLYYLAVEDESDGMVVAISLWSLAFVAGLIRGLLVDARAKNHRRAALDLIAEHPQFKSRGMPEPWIRSARRAPCATARFLRAAAVLLGVFFSIGLSAVIGDSNRTGTIVIAAILLALAAATIWLTRYISRTPGRHAQNADGHAGPRQHWIDNAEVLVSEDHQGSGLARHPGATDVA